MLFKVSMQNSLRKYHLDYKTDHNMQTSYILYFQETKINQENEISEFIDTSRYKFTHIKDKHGLLMVYKYQMQPASYQTKTCNESKFIITSFNLGISNAIYVITLYSNHSTKITNFLKILESLTKKTSIECLIVILDDLNVDFLMIVHNFTRLKIF